MRKNKEYNNKNIVIVSIMMLLLVSFLFVPRSNGSAGEAATLKSIQLEIEKILVLIASIRERIAVLMQEQKITAEKQVIKKDDYVPVKPVEIVAPPEEKKPLVLVSVPVFEKISLPNHTLAGGLAVLYHFSVTTGAESVAMPSFRFLINHSDISIKDLTMHGFEDALFSKRAFAVNLDYMGKRAGYVESGDAVVDIAVSDGAVPLVIPANTTRYFELRGTASAKNISAYVSVMLEGLPKEEFN